MKTLTHTTRTKLSKRVTESSLVFSFYLLYILVLPMMKLISIFYKKNLYSPYSVGHGINLQIFNTTFSLVKYLPLSKDILQKKVSLVGTNIYNEQTQNKILPALLSLYTLRSLSGINHLSVEDTDNEYLQNTSALYDMKLCIKFLIALIFSSTKKVYLRRINLMGVSFINTTMQNAVELIKTNVNNRKKTNIFFINADTLNKTYSNPSLRSILKKNSFVLPDGSGIKMACNMMNTPLKQNINGTDMFPFICHMAQEEGLKIFLYGAKDGVANQMKNKVQKEFPSLEIVGAINGYDIHNNEVINMINHSKADIVFVAKGAPLQEEWIQKNSKNICAPVVIGVGGLFDFYSGNIPRAPIWIREIGLEWTFRLMQEPQRLFNRYIIGNPLFLIRTYYWDKKQKRESLKKYHELVEEKEVFSFLPDISFISHYSYPVSKRILDICASSVAILLLSPLILTVAVLIRLESKGAVLFHQKRVGRNGKLFNMYKFRSMIQNAEALKKELSDTNESKDGVIFKIKNDPRITKVGKFIRKWSIDELPQLFNVLNGEMSLVGPRPPVPSEVAEYVSDDLKRLHIVPGITCYWQISGRSEIPFKQQVDLDKKYISTCCLWTDIKILFATIPAVLSHKGAY
ncbi:WecB/TagA/CpsF family glycosyltransferase [Sulfurimonas sp.]|uniref:WecB/TagA/CpsF family glycosyltransferase n=1 Tax=Sulfurimonas sp. TaxID=2022749 RepID=UPI0025F72D55|nr:WecB/TagA/CpsF family glycosyltransferase [Sulfurimonas sp.]